VGQLVHVMPIGQGEEHGGVAVLGLAMWGADLR